MIKLFTQISCLAVGLVAASPSWSQAWTHIELGAGNYGADGYTRKACEKTYLTRVRFDGEPVLLTNIPETSAAPIDPKRQYQILFNTLDELVRRWGPDGVFHVNDLIPEYADFARDALIQHAKVSGYSRITIESVPGDYLEIFPEKTLEKYGLSLYDSAHLKNPEHQIYYHTFRGNRGFTDPEYRRYARQRLQYLANLSRTGLYFFVFSLKYFPKDELYQYILFNNFYKLTREWDPVPYIFPDGRIHASGDASVLHIPSLTRGPAPVAPPLPTITDEAGTAFLPLSETPLHF